VYELSKYYLLTDRNFNTTFFDPAGGGDPVLYVRAHKGVFGFVFAYEIGLIGLITNVVTGDLINKKFVIRQSQSHG
jgi:hypothetical protein